MARTTHEKQLERARGRREAERLQRRRAIRLVVALVIVLVVAAVALGAMLLNRGGAAQRAVDSETAGLTAGDAADGEEAGDATDPAAVEPEGAVAEPCPAPSADVPEPTSTPYSAQPAVDLGGAETVRATLRTTCGEVVLELDAVAAPQTVANFVALAEDGYYEGVGFHRVINGFMVQGGDPTGTGTGCVDDGCTQRLPGYAFADELGLAEELVASSGGYPRGTVAMANAGPDTNGSQFFIVQGAPGYPLPASYTAFGSVVAGMDVVDRIAQGPVDGQLAVDPVRILSVGVER